MVNEHSGSHTRRAISSSSMRCFGCCFRCSATCDGTLLIIAAVLLLSPIVRDAITVLSDGRFAPAAPIHAAALAGDKSVGFEDAIPAKYVPDGGWKGFVMWQPSGWIWRSDGGPNAPVSALTRPEKRGRHSDQEARQELPRLQEPCEGGCEQQTDRPLPSDTRIGERRDHGVGTSG